MVENFIGLARPVGPRRRGDGWGRRHRPGCCHQSRRGGRCVAAIDRDETGLEATEAELRTLGGRDPVTAVTPPAPTASPRRPRHREGARAMQCAGQYRRDLAPGRARHLSLAEWNAVLSVNLTGYFLCAQIFGRQMRAQGRGSLVHVSSIAGSHAQGQSGAYSVSKAGVIMLSRQFASEWGPQGIRSNVVSPGMVITPMSQAFYDTPGVTERRTAVVPSRRIGSRRTSRTPSCSSPATARPMSMATRSRSTAVMSTC